MKIFGSYHGHHDAVMVSIGVAYEEIGDREDLASLPYGAGIPKAVSDMTIAGARSTTPARWSGASSASSRKAASPRA